MSKRKSSTSDVIVVKDSPRCSTASYVQYNPYLIIPRLKRARLVCTSIQELSSDDEPIPYIADRNKPLKKRSRRERLRGVVPTESIDLITPSRPTVSRIFSKTITSETSLNDSSSSTVVDSVENSKKGRSTVTISLLDEVVPFEANPNIPLQKKNCRERLRGGMPIESIGLITPSRPTAGRIFSKTFNSETSLNESSSSSVVDSVENSKKGQSTATIALLDESAETLSSLDETEDISKMQKEKCDTILSSSIDSALEAPVNTNENPPIKDLSLADALNTLAACYKTHSAEEKRQKKKRRRINRRNKNKFLAILADARKKKSVSTKGQRLAMARKLQKVTSKKLAAPEPTPVCDSEANGSRVVSPPSKELDNSPEHNGSAVAQLLQKPEEGSLEADGAANEMVLSCVSDTTASTSTSSKPDQTTASPDDTILLSDDDEDEEPKIVGTRVSTSSDIIVLGTPAMSTNSDIIVLGTPTVPTVTNYKGISKSVTYTKRGNSFLPNCSKRGLPLIVRPTSTKTRSFNGLSAEAITQAMIQLSGVPELMEIVRAQHESRSNNANNPLQSNHVGMVNSLPQSLSSEAGRHWPGMGDPRWHQPVATNKPETLPSPENKYGSNIYNPYQTANTRQGLRPVIIDGSNVAMGHGLGKFFSAKGLEICINYFVKRKHKVYAFLPLFRKNNFYTRDCHLLSKLEKEKHLFYTPSRNVDGQKDVPYDDRYIVQTAAELGGVIVSTDNYRDLLQENLAWHDTIKNRLLMFTWVEDMLIFPQDPLGKRGPKLEEFLRF